MNRQKRYSFISSVRRCGRECANEDEEGGEREMGNSHGHTSCDEEGDSE